MQEGATRNGDVPLAVARGGTRWLGWMSLGEWLGERERADRESRDGSERGAPESSP